jgi:hypothetical protein
MIALKRLVIHNSVKMGERYSLRRESVGDLPGSRCTSTLGRSRCNQRGMEIRKPPPRARSRGCLHCEGPIQKLWKNGREAQKRRSLQTGVPENGRPRHLHQAAHDALLVALPDSPVQLDPARLAGTAARIAASAGRLGRLGPILKELLSVKKSASTCARDCVAVSNRSEATLPDGVIQETG